MAGPLIFWRFGNGPGDITGILVQISGDLTERHIRTALRLQLADLAVVLAGAVKPRARTGDACARRLVAAPELHQPFAARASVFVRVRIEQEVGARESAVPAVG